MKINKSKTKVLLSMYKGRTNKKGGYKNKQRTLKNSAIWEIKLKSRIVQAKMRFLCFIQNQNYCATPLVC